jgi:hypothetical protein
MAEDDENEQEIIDKPPAPTRFAETPRLHNVIGDWWREATGQTSEWHHDLSPGRAILRKIMLWSPAVVLVLLVGGAAGVFILTGWRGAGSGFEGLGQLGARGPAFGAHSGGIRPQPAEKQSGRAAGLCQGALRGQ